MKTIITTGAFIFSVFFAQSQYWTPLGSSGVNDEVSHLTVHNNELIIGGRFTMADTLFVNKLVKWNGTEFEELLNVPGSDNVSALYSHNGELYMGRGYIPYIFKWDNSTWSNVGSGLNYPPIAMITFNSDLFVGGSFTMADSITVNYVARWDGNQWHNVGSGFNNYVSALEIYNNELYAAGLFQFSGTTPINYVARWNGSTWVPVGNGTNGRVMALKTFNGELYASGSFTTAGSVTALKIARWNGTTWNSVSPFSVNGFAISEMEIYNNNLYVAGLFTSIGANTVNNIAMWDGNNWYDLNGGTNTNGGVWALSSYIGELYAGGLFNSIGGIIAGNVAKWSDLTSIQFIVDNKELNVYPNPASDKIRISTSMRGIFLAEIFDITGKKVKEKLIESNNDEINIQELETGFYILKVEGSSFKLIKQ
jgi:trimeric autotransporter adhesin